MAEFHLIRVCGLAVLNIQTRAQMRVRPDRYIPAEAGDATFAILHFTESSDTHGQPSRVGTVRLWVKRVGIIFQRSAGDVQKRTI